MEHDVLDIQSIDMKNWVTKSNDLIEATYRLNLQEQRILLIMASKIQPSDQLIASYRFKAKDFIDVISGNGGKGYYSHLKEIVNGLQSKVLTIRVNGAQRNYNWVITSIYEEKLGYITLQFHPELKDFFLQLKEKFTTYQLENVVRLASVYSIRIYELLKRYEFQGKMTFTLDELRQYLAIEQEKYKMYGHFKKRVLQSSFDEINKKTDLRYAFQEIKSGKKVTAIRFILEKKKTNPVKEAPASDLSLRSELAVLGFSERDVQEVMQRYTMARITRNITYMRSQKETIRVKNASAYLLKAIEEDYGTVKAKKGTHRHEEKPARFTQPYEPEERDEHFKKEKALLQLELEERQKNKNIMIKQIEAGAKVF